MGIVTVIVSIAYIVFVWWLIRGWNTLAPPDKSTELRKFSIIIPVRNEAATIERLLQTLAQQHYPPHHLEIIIVNDHSTDNTAHVLAQLRNNYAFRLLELKAEQGKKQALKLGIAEAIHDTIVTIDADCVVGVNWIYSINNCYKAGVNVVVGPVSFIEQTSFFYHLQVIEFASLVGAGAATLGNGLATMCNGANFSFTKKAFYSVGGYDDNLNLASGDDEFLLHKLFRQDAHQVRFNKSANAIVYTDAASSLDAFFKQRKRWASKWSHYQNKASKLMAPVVFGFNLFYLLLPLFFLVGVVSTTLFITVLAAKTTMDFVFLSLVMRFLRKRMSVIHFLVLSVLYVVYVPLFGILGSFGKYAWKDRELR